MQITLDISMYPLADNYKEPIKALLARLEERTDLIVVFGALSTQISGELETVMDLMKNELKTSFESCPNAVFVAKIVHTACRG